MITMLISGRFRSVVIFGYLVTLGSTTRTWLAPAVKSSLAPVLVAQRCMENTGVAKNRRSRDISC